jgi:hypothetical protein
MPPRQPPEEERSMWLWVLAGAIIAIAVAGYYFWRKNQAPPPAPPVVQAPPTPPAQVEPPEEKIEHPVEAPAEPLPALADSDRAMQEAIGSVVDDKKSRDLFYPDRVVRRIVATVDNLPRSRVSQKVMPVKPVPGGFLVDVKGDVRTVDRENFARYAPYVNLLAALDTEQTVALYVKFYPLFQQAYEELGYPKRNFNDRLVQVIDHLLLTPELKGPIRLVQPKVLYEYADPELESRSAGQKILLRIGADNAQKVKAKLKEIRAKIAEGALGKR